MIPFKGCVAGGRDFPVGGVVENGLGFISVRYGEEKADSHNNRSDNKPNDKYGKDSVIFHTPPPLRRVFRRGESSY